MIYAEQEVEGQGVQQAGGGVWRVCDVLTGGICGEEQVRREVDGRHVAGDQIGER